MIIWGTRGLTSTIEEGAFHCPRCGPDKPFRIVAVNRWFTLYFIPIIPCGEAGRYLECRGCAGTFDQAAKNHDPTAEQARFRSVLGAAMLRAMVALAKADGRTDHRELEVIANVLTQISGEAFEIEDIRVAIDDGDEEPLESVLKQLSSSLTVDGKVMVIQGLSMVAKADGDVAEGELEVLYQSGTSLGLRRGDIQKIIDADAG